MSGVPLELVEGECREYELLLDGQPTPCFAVRYRGRMYTYRNRCPHTGATLNWLPDNFLTLEGDLIQCALHGALFRIEDGLCLHGPCLGSCLEPAPPPG